MANVNSLTTNSASNASSLYGTRNVLSGLASGMDTEAMIENSVSGYKTKISQLQQEQTKYQWKQDAYRVITDKMYDLNQKYTSYTSKTNIYSNAFFNNAITTTPSGEFKDKVSAVGKTSSDIQILAAQTATAARYSVDASSLGLQIPGTSGASAVNTADVTVGALKGSMTLSYGSKAVSISFDESDDGMSSLEDLKSKIEEKLQKQTIGTSKASDLIKVEIDNGAIKFSDNTNNGNSAYISGVRGNLAQTLNIEAKSSSDEGYLSNNSFSIKQGESLTKSSSMADYLDGKKINVTLDGVSKSITLKGDDLKDGGSFSVAKLQTALQNGINENFGTGKVTVSQTDGKLSFDLGSNNAKSTLSVAGESSDVSEKLGLGENGLSNYLNTQSSIKSLLGNKFTFSASNAAAKADDVSLEAEQDSTEFFKGSDGNRYKKIGEDDFRRVDNSGNFLYELTVNDKSVYVSETSSMQSVINSMNNSDMGVTASYSNLTGKLVFNAKETGVGSQISFGGGLADALFNADPTKRTLGEIFGLSGNDEITLNLTGRSGNTNQIVGQTFTAASTVEDVMRAINNKTTTGNNISSVVNYDSNTGAFSLANGNSIASMGWTLTASVNGNTTAVSGAEFFKNVDISRTEGRDATIFATVNGEEVTLNRASNTIDMDGMSVTLKEDFNVTKDSKGLATGIENDDLSVSFTSKADADNIVSTIKSFVDEYNAILKDVHDAVSTQPAEKNSSHEGYAPLTDDDKSTMSESAIAAYEKKAKQGILFQDRDLRALYDQLVRNISPGGEDSAALRSIGITSAYSNGLTQIKLDETQLRAALDKDPDSVRNAFTKTKESGAASDGLMTSIRTTMNQYASTSVSSPGILVKKAGSTHSAVSLLNNDVQKQADSVQTKIEQWQTKMSKKIDYYTRQFTMLEKLMSQMNSQSSALSGLMGGY